MIITGRHIIGWFPGYINDVLESKTTETRPGIAFVAVSSERTKRIVQFTI